MRPVTANFDEIKLTFNEEDKIEACLTPVIKDFNGIVIRCDVNEDVAVKVDDSNYGIEVIMDIGLDKDLKKTLLDEFKGKLKKRRVDRRKQRIDDYSDDDDDDFDDSDLDSITFENNYDLFDAIFSKYFIKLKSFLVKNVPAAFKKLNLEVKNFDKDGVRKPYSGYDNLLNPNTNEPSSMKIILDIELSARSLEVFHRKFGK